MRLSEKSESHFICLTSSARPLPFNPQSLSNGAVFCFINKTGKNYLFLFPNRYT